MKKRIKKILLPAFSFILVVSIIGGIYFFIYSPIIEECNQLENSISISTGILKQLRTIEFNKSQYEEELLEYKAILDRYQAFASEYGTQTKLLLMLTDIERRVGVEITDLTQAGTTINMNLKTDYLKFIDFVTELEKIEFFYSCQRISVLKENGQSYTLDELQTAILDPNELLNINFIATFPSKPVDEVINNENEIDALIKELGLEDVVVTP